MHMFMSLLGFGIGMMIASFQYVRDECCGVVI